MEFAPEGTLGALIDDIGPLAEDDTKVVASQMLDALKYLHDRGIAHRDIKPDNVLVKARPPHLHVQLTDFGLSKKILSDEETFLRTFCGTILYCAPEVYPEYLEYFNDKPGGARERVKQDKKAKRYDNAVDIWSLAGLLFYCLTKLPPYIADTSRTYHDMLRQIMTGPLDIRPLQTMNVTEWGVSFLKSMLNNMPQLRATIPELLDQPWLTGIEPNDESGAFASANTSSVADSSVADSSVVAISSIAAQAGGTRSSSHAPSLSGAESMVGDMAISCLSPVSAGVSWANLNVTASAMQPAASLRRAREVDEDDENARLSVKRHHSVVLDNIYQNCKSLLPPDCSRLYIQLPNSLQ